MAFESVKQNGPTWEPKQTGSKKENNLVSLQPTEKSYIDGYYLGCQTGQGPENNSTVHKLKMVGIGDKNHIIGEMEESQEISIWGTNVLNDNLSKAAPGQLVRIVWEGKKNTKTGGRSYHSWDVLIDKTAEPLAMGMPVGNTTAPAPAQPQGSVAAAPVTQEADDDDDLPF